MTAEKSLILKKHTGAIQAKVNQLSAVNRKALNLFILTMQVQETINQKQGLKEKTIYKVPLHLLQKVCGLKATQYVDLKEEILNIQDAKIRFEYFEKDGDCIIEETESIVLIPSLRLYRKSSTSPSASKKDDAKGYVFFEIHHKLKKELFRPEIYTPINLITIKDFKSEYSVPLYENLLNWANAKPDKPFTLTIEELRSRLGAEQKHTAFRDFKRWVIEKSVKEINDKSDLNISYRFNKKPKTNKTISVTFELIHKQSKKFVTIDDLADKLMNGESIDQVVSEFVDGLVDARLGTPEEIKSPERYKGAVAMEILKDPQNLEKVKKQAAKNKIKNEQATKSNLTESQEEKKRFSFFDRFLGK